MQPLFAILLGLFIVSGCAQTRVRRYQGVLDPMLGNGTKIQVAKKLGNPANCAPLGTGERCEYRTAILRNDPVPAVHQKTVEMGPDLSPYEYFDVLQADFDGFGVLKDWQPIVIHP